MCRISLKFHLKYFTLLILFFALNFYFSQVVDIGGPVSWDLKVDRGFKNLSSFITPSFDLQNQLDKDEESTANKLAPFRFGFEHKVHLNTINSGDWVNVEDGRIWRLKIKSPGALSINLVLDKFHLPKGVFLYLYSEDHNHLVGAYTSINNNSQNILGTDIVKGEDVIVELFEPNHLKGEVKFQISRIVHGYKDIDDWFSQKVNESGACNMDVICPDGTPWANEIKSVARIMIGGGLCTGTLVNNTLEDGTPYFLTANHCGPSSMGSAVFRFNYDSPICGSQTTANSQVPTGSVQAINGSSVVASNSDSDFGLLLLNSTPTSSMDVFYSGWNHANSIPTTGVCIHHPSGDVKKISFDDDPLQSSTYSGVSNNMWQVETWERSTTTEGGSSGAGLWDQDHYLIGQLYGGSAACGNTLSDIFGKFSMSWTGNNSNSSSTRLQDWLDPNSSGVTQLDGYSPSAPTINNDGSITSIESPTDAYCSIYIPVEFKLKNNGANTITSAEVDIILDNVVISQHTWSGSLNSGSTVNVALPNSLSVLTGGAHDLEVSIVSINNQTDGNAANNSYSGNFSNYPNTSSLSLSLTFDCWASETSWQITDDLTGSIVWEVPENTYSDVSPTGYDVIETICLTDACYEFTIFDSYGDGMYGAQYNSCNSNGNFTMTDQWNTNTYFSMSALNADFGPSESHSFCITTTSYLDVEKGKISIYPNPSNGVVNVNVIGDDFLNQELIVTDINGKYLRFIKLINNSMLLDLSDLSSGYYFASIRSKSGRLHVFKLAKK